MAENQQSVFGHKVIFINPTFPGRRELFNTLVENEFELYTIEDYRDAKNVLREFTNSLCFIYAEDSPARKNFWINYILSCAKDESINSTLFYLITTELSAKEKKLLEGVQPWFAGTIRFNERAVLMENDIVEILNKANAKGRRQYVRINCAEDKNATAMVDLDGRLFKMKMQDISVAGSACTVESKFAPFFAPKTVLPSVTFSLGGKTVSGSMVVYTTIPMEHATKLVMLFTNGVSKADKENIHNYITDQFQNTVFIIGASHTKDEEDYSKRSDDE